MYRLKGKVAVVTGSSKGIGAAIAEQFAAEGASVVVNCASSKSGADAVVARIRQKEGKAVAVQADVSDAESVRRLFAEARKAAQGEDLAAIKRAIDDLQRASQAVAEGLYQGAKRSSGAAGSQPSSGAPDFKEGEVVDAEYADTAK